NTQLAALLGDGRISWITYADRLMEFPSALLGVALGTVLLPSLARHYHDANHGQYRELLDWGLRVTFLLALPAALALALLGAPLIATLYQYGRFSVDDVWQTRAALLRYRALRRQGIYVPAPGWSGFLARLGIALIVLGAVLWWGAGPDEVWVRAGLAAKATRLSLVIVAGGVAYFVSLWLLGFRFRD